MDGPPFFAQIIDDLLFKWAIRLQPGRVDLLNECPRTTNREIKIVLKVSNTCCANSGQVNLFGHQGAENNNALSRTGYCYVEATMAALKVQGAEVQGHLAGRIRPIGNREVDDVPLVTLDIFKVLDEY